jgi:hypothetical protein
MRPILRGRDQRRAGEQCVGGNFSGVCVSGTDIFLSYARQDRARARTFAECLKDEGFQVWWDASLHSGETFDEVIERNLRDARAVVVLWSPRSVASRWVRAEATLADRRNKLVPAIIEPCDRPIVFELTHTAELSDWDGDTSDVHWRTFVEDLHRMIDKAREAGADQVAASAQPSPLRKVEDISARASAQTRQPLRPGNHEVLLAARHPRQAPVPAPAETPDADASSDVHCLEAESTELGEQLFVISSSSVKLGRSAPADIVIPHKSVSREHCIIGLANDELFVTDLNSTNGTFIDGERIGRATILPVGSVVQLGGVRLKHVIRNAAEVEGDDAGIQDRGTPRAGRFAASS